MAQDPLKPKDDGKMKLPRVDAAQNKLPPDLPKGGKGAEDDKENVALGEDADDAKDQEILARARKRFDKCISAEAENRKEALDDLQFYAGDQWPSDIKAQRNAEQRPCLTINGLPTIVKQVTNDIRQNRPGINVSPVGDRSDPEVAKMYAGLIRFIERDCSADIAYDTAAESAARCGFGYWRLLTIYESGDSFNQVIVIKRVRNAFTVYLDPGHQEPDGEDARYGFITEMIPREEFEDQYPKADPMPWTQAGVGESLKNWIEADAVRVAEYFEIDTETRALVALSNGHEGWEDELGEEARAALGRGELEIVNRRESEQRKVRVYKITAKEILERRDWLGSTIPIVKVIGDEVDIKGRPKYSGIVRHAKDPQRMRNYWRTLQTERVALAPKAKWVAEEGQIEGHETEWKTANTSPLSVLTYKATSSAGTPAPPPQRVAPEGIDAGVESALQGAVQDIQATTGVRFDASIQERMLDESGKAIRELRRSGDIGSFNYVDNFCRALRRTGRMMVELIPLVYDNKRAITILREDDKEERVQIDPAAARPYQEAQPRGTPQDPAPKKLKIFNPTYGKYGVTVTIGPSYATKRIEASEQMMAFVKAVPNAANLVMDLIAKYQDWPGADEIARRLTRAIPPQFLMPEQKDIPPQIAAIMQGMDRQIKQHTVERMQLMRALGDKRADRAQRQDEIDKNFEAKILKVVADTEKAFQAQIGTRLDQLADGVNELMAALAKPAESTEPTQSAGASGAVPA